MSDFACIFCGRDQDVCDQQPCAGVLIDRRFEKEAKDGQ